MHWSLAPDAMSLFVVNPIGVGQPEAGRDSKVRIGEESTLASPLLLDSLAIYELIPALACRSGALQIMAEDDIGSLARFPALDRL